MFYKIGAFESFAKLTVRQSHFVIKLDAFMSSTLLKNTLRQLFSCKFHKIFMSTIFTKHIRKSAFDENYIL